MAKKFYKCENCGNIAAKYVDSGVPMVCCGQPMTELVANSTDAAGEKHVPVVEISGNKVVVKVGEVAHPMTEAHLISWIYLETNFGGHERVLSHTDEPRAEFVLAEGEKALRAYEYCNLHGLWSAEIK